ncbi:MAG: nucleotidyltransferase family protein [SAR202 cluster bacterium]|jgi:molybdenum cofactor cytidylyltransferase|nr:nucleotidyltransferase family protein [SAR202 cluster bacterium]
MDGVTAIITAAGESTRMGQPKALLQWQGVTLIDYQTTSLLSGGVANVVVVLGHEAARIEPNYKKLGVQYVVNSNYRQGRSASIVAGLEKVESSTTTIMLLGVDQPRPPSIITTVLGYHKANQALITSPRYQGRGGHPLVFSALLRSELETITEEHKGIRALFRTHPNDIAEVPIDDPIVCLDLNTPEEYETAKNRYGEGL